jgi:hypothetical protein
MPRNVPAWLALFIAAALAHDTARADEITQVQGYSFLTGPVVTPIQLQFDPFDPSRGSLLGVQYRFSFTVQNASVDFENIAAVPVLNDISVGHVNNYIAPGLLLFPGPVARSHSIELFRDFVSFPAFDGIADFAGADNFAFRQAGAVNAQLVVDLTDFTEYIRNSPLLLDIVSIFNASAGGSPTTVRIRLNGDEVTGRVELRYEFAPATVDEPSTLALIVSLAVLFRCSARRREPLCKPTAQ